MRKQLMTGLVLLGLGMTTLSFQNCAQNPEAESTQQSSTTKTPNGTSEPNVWDLYDKSTALTLADHRIHSDLINCDYLNPDAAKNLDVKVIELLATQLPSGLTLHHHYMIAVNLGYRGLLGKGEAAAWYAYNPQHQQARAIAEAEAQQFDVPNFNLRKSQGYKGVFTCGGAACYLEGSCDIYGRRL